MILFTTVQPKALKALSNIDCNVQEARPSETATFGGFHQRHRSDRQDPVFDNIPEFYTFMQVVQDIANLTLNYLSTCLPVGRLWSNVIGETSK